LFAEHAEAGHDAGFHRETLQQTFAKGVNGLYLQSARRIEGASKKTAGAGKRCPAGLVADEGTNLFQERFIIKRDPFAQIAKQALRHFGSGGIGESYAEDAFRQGPVEQETNDTMHEDLSFPGARIGGHPGGNLRIGGAALGAIGRERPRLVHQGSPSAEL
jgi:hypothetical protein